MRSKVIFSPAKQVGLEGSSLVDCEYRPDDGLLHSSSLDPQIFLRPDAFDRRGWYVLTLRSSAAGERSQLFVDIGDGLNERHSVRFASKGDSSAAMIFLPRRAKSVRFDPTDRPESLGLRDLRVRRLGLPEVLALFCARAWKIISTDPGAFTRRLHQLLRGEITSDFISLAAGRTAAATDYKAWIETCESRFLPVGKRCGSPPEGAPTRFSILMPTYNSDLGHLRAAIASVVGQSYPHWELCIADDASTAKGVRETIMAFAANDARIKTAFRALNGHISLATNTALEMATGDFVIPFDHDDLIRPFALEMLAEKVARDPEVAFMYSDEDKIDVNGLRYEPNFKPSFSPTLLRCQNYFNHLTALRSDIVRQVGGWREGYEGSQDYDLYLRFIEQVRPEQIVHIPGVLYHWRAAPGSTAAASSNKEYAVAAGLKALGEHLQRQGIPAREETATPYPFYRLRFRIPLDDPKVSIIIPTRNLGGMLQRAVTSAIEKAGYHNFEILIVDNQSNEAETLDVLRTLSAHDRISVHAFPYPFNFSEINNFAAERALGEILIFLNNDTQAITDSWLAEVVGWIAHSPHGCVGVKLLYPGGTIQHAGVVLGVGGVANHLHLDFPADSPGYMGRLVCAQDVSAVTGAFLGVRKAVFDEVGGFNAAHLPVAFNDVDLCMRVTAAGYRNVYVPDIKFFHYESASRGDDLRPEKRARFEGEVRYMHERWGDQIKSDPYYSFAFDQARSNFSLGC